MSDEGDYLITIEVMRRDGETWVRVLLDGNDVTDGITEKALIQRALPAIFSLAARRAEIPEGD